MTPPPGTTSTARRRRARLLTALAVVLLSLGACELVVRAVVRRDADGQEWIGERRLRPFRLPLASIAERLAALEDGRTFFAWDPDLGWAPRRNATSASGLAHVGYDGIRGVRPTALAPTPGVLRVAVFGDSFTFGDEVGDDDTWAVALERALAEHGIAAEVLNFGVNGYGTDQAYLRWRRDGRRFAPDVVVYGFQPENALRNLNVFRALYFAATDMPLQKPRFLLEGGADDRALRAIGQPTIAPRDMLAALADLDRQPLAAYDRYAPPYFDHWWLRSKLLALLVTIAANDLADPFRLDDESRTLARALIDRFAREVTESGAAFVVVHLPRREDLTTMHAGGEPWYAELLREIASRHRVVDPSAAMQQAREDGFEKLGHYAAEMNAIVAAELADPVAAAARER